MKSDAEQDADFLERLAEWLDDKTRKPFHTESSETARELRNISERITQEEVGKQMEAEAATCESPDKPDVNAEMLAVLHVACETLGAILDGAALSHETLFSVHKSACDTIVKAEKSKP